MTTLFERSTPTQWGPIAASAGPHHQAFVVSMRALYDKRKARNADFGYETIAKEAFTSVSTISRIMNGKQLPTIDATFAIVKVITGRKPSKSLVAQWRRAAAEKPANKDMRKVKAQILKAYERLEQENDHGAGTDTPVGKQRRIVGSARGVNRALAVTTGAASAILVIVAFLIGRPWIAAAAVIPIAVFVSLALPQWVAAVLALAHLLTGLRHTTTHRHRNRDDAD
jgi:hypothetical protein